MTKEEASLKTTREDTSLEMRREDTSLEMTKGDCTRKGRDQGKSGAVLQPLSHCAEGLASVGNGILLFFRYVGKSHSRIFISNEYRIISEAAVT